MQDLTHQEKSLSRQSNFSISMPAFPSFVYHVKGVTIPGITVEKTNTATPYGSISDPGTTAEFEDLAVEFAVSEDFSNYLLMQNWLRSYTSTKNLGDNVKLRELILGPGVDGIDISIFINNNMGKPVAEYIFTDCFPATLTSLDYRTDNNEAAHLIATVTFDYDYFELKKVDQE